MIELKNGPELSFYKVIVTSIKDNSKASGEYLVNEYEAPNGNLAIAFVMEKISSLVAVNHVSVIEFKTEFPDELLKKQG